MSPQAPTKSEKYLAAWVRGLASLLSRLTSANWQVETASDYAPLASVRIICRRRALRSAVPGSSAQSM